MENKLIQADLNNSKHQVSVIIVTYNHKDYISDCINGVLKQITNFSYEIIIHDDASTDGTTNTILEFTERNNKIIPIIQKENQYSKGYKPFFDFALKKATGKYIALCDGDDFWTDPFKLQKQVDFLEANQEYGMVYTNYQKLDANKKEIRNIDCDKNILEGEIYHKYLSSSFIGTLTVMFRKTIIDEYLNTFSHIMNNWAMGDRPLWLYIASKSKCGFISDYTGVYRRNDKSVSSFKDIYKEIEFFKKSYDIRYYFINHVRAVSDKIREQVDDSYHRGLLAYYSRANDIAKSQKHYLKIKTGNTNDYLFFLKTKSYVHNRYVKIVQLAFRINKKLKRSFSFTS